MLEVLNLLKEVGVVPNTISYNIVFENLERMEMQ